MKCQCPKCADGGKCKARGELRTFFAAIGLKWLCWPCKLNLRVGHVREPKKPEAQ